MDQKYKNVRQHIQQITSLQVRLQETTNKVKIENNYRRQAERYHFVTTRRRHIHETEMGRKRISMQGERLN